MNAVTAIKKIYTPKYVAVNIAALILYYFLARYLVITQEKVFLVVDPLLLYLMYILILSASITLTIAIYSIGNTRKNMAKVTATGVSAFTALVGSVIVSCGCAVPILFSLTAIGISSAGIIALNNFFSKYSIWIVSTFIFLNLLLIIYYLNKLSKPSCEVKVKRR
ncbi:MAG: hypothetical protein ACP5UC_00975 [Candidatus Micrarchaeia archaeon]